MKNIKDITISIFAIIGFLAIVSGFTNNETENQQTYGTPESHVWEMVNVDGRAYAINKVTGEVKAYVRAVKGTSGPTIGLKAYTGRDLKYGDNGKI